MNNENRYYLGNGLYIEYTGYSYILKANNHIALYCTDFIEIDSEIIEEIFKFKKRMENK